MARGLRSRSSHASPGLRRILSREVIARRVEELGADIGRAILPRERPVAVVVLQGAFVFAADLLRQIPERLGVEVAFLRCESYGADTRSKGRVLLLQDLDAPLNLRGRTVLLVDDILDTGLTLRFLVKHLRARGARRVRVCVLLRRKAGRKGGVKADWVGFEVGPQFVVGYGLDFAGRYRHLPNLAVLPKSAGKRAP